MTEVEQLERSNTRPFKDWEGLESNDDDADDNSPHSISYDDNSTSTEEK